LTEEERDAAVVYWQSIVTASRAVLLGRASEDQRSFTIGSRALESLSPKELRENLEYAERRLRLASGAKFSVVKKYVLVGS
jgi:hypothetical protein